MLIPNRDKVGILNKLISKFNYTNYLEIGIDQAQCISNITASKKTGVDPSPDVLKMKLKNTEFICVTSDCFFSLYQDKYDLIFIDGCHYYQQVYRDIVNSINQLNANGTIVVHDCNPKTEMAQRVPRQSRYWSGDVWKAIVRLRQELTDYEIFVIDVDCGIGIIRQGKNEPLILTKPINDLTWIDLHQNRTSYLNIKPITEL